MSPDDAAALVAEEHGLGLAVVTPLGGGAVGAHEVMWSGGGRGVMKQLVGHGTRAGDAAFDPVTLAFCSAVAVAERAAVDRLWSHVLTARTPAVAHAYVAYLSLRQVDWFIRHDVGQAGTWTTTAESHLDRF